MTNEPTAEPFEPQGGYLQIQVPGVPYSALRVPIVGNLEADNLWIEHALLIAQLTAKAYAEAFPQMRQEAPERPSSPRPTGRPATPARRPQTAKSDLDPNLIVEGICPEHGVPAHPSILKYQEVEMSDEGVERYAKYFCPGKDNGTGTNHALWARELV